MKSGVPTAPNTLDRDSNKKSFFPSEEKDKVPPFISTPSTTPLKSMRPKPVHFRGES